MDAASMSSTGCRISRNCGTAKSYSPWKVERPIRSAPARLTCMSRRIVAVLPAGGGGPPPRPGPAPARKEGRGPPRREHTEQPNEDEVVRGVGERALVAPGVDVRGDVPVHPEHRDDQRHAEHRERHGGPARK